LFGNRLKNWDSALFKVIESKRHLEFEWSVNDCLIFAAEIESAICADRKLTWVFDFVGLYRSEQEAAQLMSKDDAWQIMDDYFNQIDRAQRGDIIGLEHNEQKCLGVWLGEKGAFLGENGLKFVSRKSVDRAWSLWDL